MSTLMYPHMAHMGSESSADAGPKTDAITPQPQTNTSPPVRKDSGSQTSSSQESSGEIPDKNYRLASQDEWLLFCRGIGVIREDAEKGDQQVIRPTSLWWPPKGFRDGLYKDVLTEKTKFKYNYHILKTIHWLLMVIQLSINAVLTALGSVSLDDKTVITITAAVNTCISGLLALMHNGGLPDRYRQDRNQFAKIEEHLKSIVDSRLVPANESMSEVLAGCYRQFREARQTVADNFPSSYTPSPSSSGTPTTTAGTTAPTTYGPLSSSKRRLKGLRK